VPFQLVATRECLQLSASQIDRRDFATAQQQGSDVLELFSRLEISFSR
jgi:hypothetical protein